MINTLLQIEDIDIALPGMVGLFTGVFGLLVMIIFAFRVLGKSEGDATKPNDKKQIEVAKAIQEGAAAFLRAEYKRLAIFVVLVFVGLLVVIGIVNEDFADSTWLAVNFLAGALVSAATGYLGMWIAVRANVRTTEAAKTGVNEALRVAFESGTVMGLSVVSLGLMLVSVAYWIFQDFAIVAGLGFGASSIALFARVGGGIFTKAADVGADLVGKVESGIPEDDPRNPATIADNVGDNVGDVAGMGADLFESYLGSLIAAGTLGKQVFPGEIGFAYPVLIAASGIVASIIGTLTVRTSGNNLSQNKLLWAMRTGVIVSSILSLGGAAIWTAVLEMSWAYFLSVLTGLLAGVIIGEVTEYYTSFEHGPVKGIGARARTGPATVIIEGLAVGMMSTVLPTIIIAATILLTYFLGDLADGAGGGVYAVSIAAVGMLATLGATLATDAYGPVADNAGGIAEMAEHPEEVRERTDALDALGNTTAATGKGFAVGSAVLTSIALLNAFAAAANISTVDLIEDPVVIPGFLVGAMLPYMFAALTMRAVGQAAMAVIFEVRRQFRELNLLTDPNSIPDHGRCVELVTAASLKHMLIPGAIAVGAPIIIGVGVGPKALAGMLTGGIISGFLLAVMMANAGGAWDNTKKYIETGELGGKGSENHKAAVVGDTVGDPFKDTSGPSLNILIKLMSIISLVLAPIFTEDNDNGWWIALILLAILGIFSCFVQVVLGKEEDISSIVEEKKVEEKKVEATPAAAATEEKKEETPAAAATEEKKEETPAATEEKKEETPAATEAAV